MGLEFDENETKCLPTFIHPKKVGVRGKSTFFDLGGTNFKVAVIEIDEKQAIEWLAERNITEMRTTALPKRICSITIGCFSQQKTNLNFQEIAVVNHTFICLFCMVDESGL